MIHLSDARDLLATLPDGSVDMIASDVPYRTISGGNSVGKGVSQSSHGRPSGMLAKNDGKIFTHNDIEPHEYMSELFRVLSDPGHMWIFTNELNRRKMEDAILNAGFRIHYLGGWVKNTCTPNRWGMKNCEPFFVAYKGKARGFYAPGTKQMLHHDTPRNKVHPTEKPISLMREMVLASSKVGDIVLDPFCGAGATGVAAVSEGRRFIGCEIDPKYAFVAMHRIHGVT